jgi:hypothetical protein
MLPGHVRKGWPGFGGKEEAVGCLVPVLTLLVERLAEVKEG